MGGRKEQPTIHRKRRAKMAATDKLTLVVAPKEVIQGEISKLTAKLVNNANQPIGQIEVSFEQTWPGEKTPTLIEKIVTSDQGIAVCQFTVEKSSNIAADQVSVSAKTAEGIAAPVLVIGVYPTADQKELKEKRKLLDKAKEEQHEKNQAVQTLTQKIETLEKDQKPPAAISDTKAKYEQKLPELQRQAGEIQTAYQQAEQVFNAQFPKAKADKIAEAYKEIDKAIETKGKQVDQLQQEVDKLEGQIATVQTVLAEKTKAWAETLNIQQVIDDVASLKTKSETINKGIKDGIADGKNKDVATYYRQLIDSKGEPAQRQKSIVQPTVLENNLLALWNQLKEQTKQISTLTEQQEDKKAGLTQAKTDHKDLKDNRDKDLEAKIEEILNA